MKNPNGYGSVIKLSGKRRKPFAVRITKGYDNNGKQLFKYLGYYGTRKEALTELALYTSSPYDIDTSKITFSDLFNRFLEVKKDKISVARLNVYKSCYNKIFKLHNLKIQDIKLVHLQTCVDELSKTLSSGTVRTYNNIIDTVLKYGVKLELLSKNYASFVELPKHEKIIIRKIFTSNEIDILWENVNKYCYIDILLILIYTGMRVSELLELKKDNIDLNNNILKGGNKTEAGKNRIIPIHPKIYPLIKFRMDTSSEWLISDMKNQNSHLKYAFFRKEFNKLMELLNMQHTIHDTRHTFATLIREVSNKDEIITRIIGHTNIKMTDHYTHTSIENIRKEIEKIN